MNVIQRIHHEADVELSLASGEQLRIGLRSQLGIKRLPTRFDFWLDNQGSQVRWQLDPLDHAPRRHLRRRLCRELDIRRVSRILHRPHQFLEVRPQGVHVAPGAFADHAALAVDHKFAVRRIAHRVLDRIVDRVTDPGEP